ncbi:hypothetical protein U9M48_018922 [Paspalum notatum var. saurae]|uniref:Uncharacterized protein n=1 Tax=Paspalum notatum var. saurae TaxID=547442 RepID=A0AAQ3WQ92_PASNO
MSTSATDGPSQPSTTAGLPTLAAASPAAPSTPVTKAHSASGSSMNIPPPPTLEFVTLVANDEEQLDAAHSESPVRYHTYGNILWDNEPAPGYPQQELDLFIQFSS